MLSNYLKTTLRLMVRERAHTIIHLVGLALGLGTCLVIGQFVRHETSFDGFHENADQLVRVLSTSPGRTPGVNQPSTLGPTLLEELPGVEASVRFDGGRYDILMAVGETRDYENGLIYADANVFEEFSFLLQQGDPATALVEPYSIVITPAIARKYFGETDPMGHQIRLRNRMDMTVTGIVAPPPANSSIQFDLIGSFATQREQQWMIRNNPWNMRSFPTYLRLAKGVDREDLAAAIPSLLMTHTTSESVTRYELEPLRSIYLDSVGGDGGLGISGDEHDVYLFATTATLVLLLACINYTNLATARSTRRAREVGVRKAIGAHPASLRMQFMGESVAMCLTAGLIGAMIAELGTELLQRMEAITLADLPWTDPVFVAGYVGVAILTGLMSGLYPALVLSRSEVATTVHHRGRSGGSPLLRRGLVVAQFSIATALLVGVLVIRQQLQYIQDQRLGLQTQQVLAIDNHGGLDLAQSRIFRQELRRNAAILSASASSALPSRGHTSRTIEIEGTEEEYWIAEYHADEELISTLGIDIIEGRGLTEQDEILSARHLVINQTAANNFGWEKPLNQTISFNGDAWRVVGVMADFHTESMRSRVWPLMLGPSSEWGFDYLVVRLKPDELVAGIDHIERTWARFVPDQPLQTRWLDQSFANLYTRERQLGWLFTLFSGVAILIASVGLYGLAAYAAQARTTYRVEVGPFTFVIAGVLVTVIAALTVGHQSIRAALTDPVKTLRCE